MNKSAAFFLFLSISQTQGFVLSPRATCRTVSLLRESTDPIVSPFENSGTSDGEGGAVATTETLEGPLELTWENVEKVLDEMRPYLIQDGGNVAITEIDGPVVRLELQVRLICFVLKVVTLRRW